MYDHTDNNWSHQNSNKKSLNKFRGHTRQTFNSFTTKDSCTWNITHNTESTASETRSLSSGDHRRLKGRSTKRKRYVTRDKEIIDNDDDDNNNNYYYYHHHHHSVPYYECAGTTAIRPTAETTKNVRKIHK